MRPQSLMNFALRTHSSVVALRCVRIFPGVNSRAELVTLAPGLRPERRFAPLARGLFHCVNAWYICGLFCYGIVQFPNTIFRLIA